MPNIAKYKANGKQAEYIAKYKANGKQAEYIANARKKRKAENAAAAATFLAKRTDIEEEVLGAVAAADLAKKISDKHIAPMLGKQATAIYIGETGQSKTENEAYAFLGTRGMVPVVPWDSVNGPHPETAQSSCARRGQQRRAVFISRRRRRAKSSTSSTR